MSVAISARKLRKAYGKRVAVADLSFDVTRGTVLALVGANGSGKSTILSMVAGLTMPSSGDISVEGQVPRSARLLGRIGVLPQGDFLVTTAVGPFLRFLARVQGLSQPERMVDEVLDEFGDRAWAGSRFRDLSYGMRRRVGIAQAFLGSPVVVLLDEPTDGLDADAIERVRQGVAARCRGQTCIVASHDPGVVEGWCDESLSLAAGAIVVHRAGSHVASPPEVSRAGEVAGAV